MPVSLYVDWIIPVSLVYQLESTRTSLLAGKSPSVCKEDTPKNPKEPSNPFRVIYNDGKRKKYRKEPERVIGGKFESNDGVVPVKRGKNTKRIRKRDNKKSIK